MAEANMYFHVRITRWNGIPGFTEWSRVILDISEEDLELLILKPLRSHNVPAMFGGLKFANILKISVTRSATPSTEPDALRRYEKTPWEAGRVVYGVGAMPFDVWFAYNAEDVSSHYIDHSLLAAMEENQRTINAQDQPAHQPKVSQEKHGLIFLCHAREDRFKAREVYDWLFANRYAPWLDAVDLLPGQNWEREIEKAIERCAAIMICLTRESISKTGYVQREIALALELATRRPEGAIFVIPARLEECEVPRRLQHLQWVDLFQSDGKDLLRKTLALLK